MSQKKFKYFWILAVSAVALCACHKESAAQRLNHLRQHKSILFSNLNIRGGKGKLTTSGPEGLKTTTSLSSVQYNQGNAYTFQRHSNFLSVSFVCILEILVNYIRPDAVACLNDGKCSGARAQRAVWDLIMAGVAFIFSKQDNPPSPAGYLFLQIMLVCTALVDILFYSPLYSFATEWETCVCKNQGFFRCLEKDCADDYMLGFGRIAVVVQSMFTGLFFLANAIVAGGAFRYYRDEAKAKGQASAIAIALEQVQQGQQQQ